MSCSWVSTELRRVGGTHKQGVTRMFGAPGYLGFVTDRDLKVVMAAGHSVCMPFRSKWFVACVNYMVN